MQILKQETIPIRAQNDIVIVRQKVRSLTIELGFSLVDQTKVITGASELARNTLEYGGGGDLTLEYLADDRSRKGVRLRFEDKGPGIEDLNLALTDGYTTGKGLGMGLTGTRRLMNEFEIESKPGEGTKVVCTKWK